MRAAACIPRAPCATSTDGCSTDISCANGSTFSSAATIKRRVTFEFGNMTQTPMPSAGVQDVIFCKNVAIYFSADVTRRLIKGLHDTLTPDGYLLLGHAESLWQVSDQFALVEHDRLFCYRKGRQHLKVRRGASGSTFRPDTGSGYRPLMRRDAIRLLSVCFPRRRLGRSGGGTVGSCPVVSDVCAGTAPARWIARPPRAV